MQSIKEHLGSDWTDFSVGIREYLGSNIDLLNSTNDNLLANSGKQVRPLLALLLARACSGSTNSNTIRYAVSAELLHNATLLHDDVADQSDERRGKPTLRALMGPEVSVLVGDFWLVCALRAIMDCNVGRDRCLQLFSQTLGSLAEGEMLQLQKAASCDTDMDDYLSIIYRKTSSLFVAATQSAAISVQASPKVEKAAADFGKYVGYAFQIKDDILDYDGDSNLGKPLGVDVMEQKITLPLLGAFYNAGAEKEAMIRAQLKHVDESVRDGVVRFVKENGGIAYAQTVLETYVQKAIDCLDVLGPSAEKEMLVKLANYIAVRNR